VEAGKNNEYPEIELPNKAPPNALPKQWLCGTGFMESSSFHVAASFRTIKLTLAGYNCCAASESTGVAASDCPKSWQIVGKMGFDDNSSDESKV
jgi:hypothetical protein